MSFTVRFRVWPAFSWKKCCFFSISVALSSGSDLVYHRRLISRKITLYLIVSSPTCFVVKSSTSKQHIVVSIRPAARPSRVSPTWPATRTFGACRCLFHPVIFLGAIRFGPGCGRSVRGVRRSSEVLPLLIWSYTLFCVLLLSIIPILLFIT